MFLLTKGLILVGDVGIDELRVKAEVNRGNAPMDPEILRLYRNESNREYYQRNKIAVKETRMRRKAKAQEEDGNH
jgi:hypothetical protein